MHDPSERTDIEIAYVAAGQALADEVANRRRRAAVLGAVREAASGAPRRVARPASNEPRWRPGSNGWRASVAACLLGLSVLLVSRLGDEPAGTGGWRKASSLGAPRSTDATVAGQAAADDPGRPAQGGPARSVVTPSKATPAPDMPVDRYAKAPSRAAVASAAPPGAAHRSAEDSAVRAPPSSHARSDLRIADRATVAQAATAQTAPAAADDQAAQARRSGQAAEDAASRETASLQRQLSIAPKSELALPDSSTTGAAAVPADSPDTASKARAVRTSGGLLAAAKAGDLEGMGRRLATARPDDEVDPEGRTALAVAILRSDARMVSLLLAHGANRMLPDRQGKSPMDHAIAIQNPAVMQALQRQ